MQSEREENSMVRTLVLMSTMSAAADVISGMVERRLGRDPTSQEGSEAARLYLRSASEELDDHLVALRAGRAVRQSEAGSRVMSLARTVNEMLLLNRMVRLFHGIHQRLLSLYPAVPDELVEQARILEGALVDARDRVGQGSTPGLAEEAEIFNVSLKGLVAVP